MAHPRGLEALAFAFGGQRSGPRQEHNGKSFEETPAIGLDPEGNYAAKTCSRRWGYALVPPTLHTIGGDDRHAVYKADYRRSLDVQLPAIRK